MITWCRSSNELVNIFNVSTFNFNLNNEPPERYRWPLQYVFILFYHYFTNFNDRYSRIHHPTATIVAPTQQPGRRRQPTTTTRARDVRRLEPLCVCNFFSLLLFFTNGLFLFIHLQPSTTPFCLQTQATFGHHRQQWRQQQGGSHRYHQCRCHNDDTMKCQWDDVATMDDIW
jgi:hypothetical protein